MNAEKKRTIEPPLELTSSRERARCYNTPRLLWLQQTMRYIPRIDMLPKLTGDLPPCDRLYGTDIQYEDVLFLCSCVDVRTCTVTFDSVPAPAEGKSWWLVFDMGYDYNVYGSITVRPDEKVKFLDKVSSWPESHFEGRASWGRVLAIPISVEEGASIKVTFSFAFRARDGFLKGAKWGFSFVFPALGKWRGDTQVTMNATIIQPGSYCVVGGLPSKEEIPLENKQRDLKKFSFNGTRKTDRGGMIVRFKWEGQPDEMEKMFGEMGTQDQTQREPMVHIFCLDTSMMITYEYDPQYHALMAMTQLFDRIPVRDTIYLCQLNAQGTDQPKVAKVGAESSLEFQECVARGRECRYIDIDKHTELKKESKEHAVKLWEFGVLAARFEGLHRLLEIGKILRDWDDINFIKIACDDLDEEGKDDMATSLPRGRPLTQDYRKKIYQVLYPACQSKGVEWKEENPMISKSRFNEDQEKVQHLLERMREHQKILEWEEQLTVFRFDVEKIKELAEVAKENVPTHVIKREEESCNLSPTFDDKENREKPFSRFTKLNFPSKNCVEPIPKGSRRAMYQYAHWRGKDAVTTMAKAILRAREIDQVKYYAVPTASDSQIHKCWARTKLKEEQDKINESLEKAKTLDDAKWICLQRLPAHWLPDYRHYYRTHRDPSASESSGIEETSNV